VVIRVKEVHDMYSFKFCFIITNIGMLNVQLLIGQNSDQLHDTIVILYNLVSLLKCTIRVETCNFEGGVSP
jgi:hypothetical protein